jgi:hypothetical protein
MLKEKETVNRQDHLARNDENLSGSLIVSLKYVP